MANTMSPTLRKIPTLFAVSLALSYSTAPVSSLSATPASQAFKTVSGRPVSRYGLGGAARSTQPATLPTLYRDELARQADDGSDGGDAAPFLFYYNPHRYPAFMSGIKELCNSNGDGGIKRQDMFVAGGGTDRSTAELDRRLSDALEYSGGTYLDLFVIEYACPEELAVIAADGNRPAADPTMRLEAGVDLKNAINHARGWVEDGSVRYVAISTHSHVVGAVLARHPDVDALMLRYGMSHRDAAESVSFPAAKQNGKPVIAFTTTRWNSLQDGHGAWPAGEVSPPTTGDCLSFALAGSASPPVEVVLHSARDEDELREAMAGLRVGMAEEEETKWRAYGELFEASNEDWFDEYPEERFLGGTAVSQ